MTTAVTNEMVRAAIHQASCNGLVGKGPFQALIEDRNAMRQVLEAALNSKAYLRNAERRDRRTGRASRLAVTPSA